MRAAYVVLWLAHRDLRSTVITEMPTIGHVGVYSEPSPSSAALNKHYPIEFLQADGRDYEEAMDNLARIVGGNIGYGWLMQHLEREFTAHDHTGRGVTRVKLMREARRNFFEMYGGKDTF